MPRKKIIKPIFPCSACGSNLLDSDETNCQDEIFVLTIGGKKYPLCDTCGWEYDSFLEFVAELDEPIKHISIESWDTSHFIDRIAEMERMDHELDSVS